MALLRLEYGVFNSPLPAALYHVDPAAVADAVPGGTSPSKTRKQKHTSADYFCIMLTLDIIAEGATESIMQRLKSKQAKVMFMAIPPSQKSLLNKESDRGYGMNIPSIST